MKRINTLSLLLMALLPVSAVSQQVTDINNTAAIYDETLEDLPLVARVALQQSLGARRINQ